MPLSIQGSCPWEIERNVGVGNFLPPTVQRTCEPLAPVGLHCPRRAPPKGGLGTQWLPLVPALRAIIINETERDTQQDNLEAS
jgi:hypothetical protein